MFLPVNRVFMLYVKIKITQLFTFACSIKLCVLAYKMSFKKHVYVHFVRH